MSNIKNEKFGLVEAERERFSNFVVDLRRQEKVIVKDIKSRQKMWRPDLKLVQLKLAYIVKNFFKKSTGVFKVSIRPPKQLLMTAQN